jgi:hypothetical protein
VYTAYRKSKILPKKNLDVIKNQSSKDVYAVVWDMTPCSPVACYQHFRGNCSFHLQGRGVNLGNGRLYMKGAGTSPQRTRGSAE